MRHTTAARFLVTFFVALLLAAPALGIAEAYAAGTRIRGILLVNKHHPVPRSFAPGNDPRARSQVNRLIQAARSEGLNVCTTTSGFRSFERQRTIFNNNVARMGRAEAERWSARPGHSEHQTGLAFDLRHRNGQLLTQRRETRWVANNAHRFGFIVRYPAGSERITGFAYEPWHLRYVGIDNATEIHRRGIVLEQFLGVGAARNYRTPANSRNVTRNTSNNRLSNLRVRTANANFTQNFAATRHSYRVNIHEDIPRVEIQPTRGNRNQTVRHRIDTRRANGTWNNGNWSRWRHGFDGNNRIGINVNEGQARRVRIAVRDNNRNVRIYTVNLRRASTNTFASALRTNTGSFDRAFARAVEDYTLTVGATRTSVNVGMDRAQANAQMRTRVGSGNWSSWSRSNQARTVNIPASGNQTVQFQVRGAFSNVASSPTRTRIYTINIVRRPHTVSFNTHGGNAVANMGVQHNRPIGTLPVPTRAGYNFEGWFTAQSGGTRITANTTVSAALTAHARWTAQPAQQTAPIQNGRTDEDPYLKEDYYLEEDSSLEP